MSRREILDSFMAEFAQITGARRGTISPDEYAEAEELVRAKFATEAWLHRVP
jgi:lipoate-protein ligase A